MTRRQTGAAGRRKVDGATMRRSASAPAEAATGKNELLKLYRDMLLIRRFEERAGQLYGMGLIGGFCHLYIGQEAVAVGVQSVKQPGDQVITGYRDHGHMLACGMDPREVMAELTGRAGLHTRHTSLRNPSVGPLEPARGP